MGQNTFLQERPASETGEDKLERRITVETEEGEEAGEEGEEEAGPGPAVETEPEQQQAPSLNFGDVLFGER
jgi:hypothetical protein